MGIIDVNAKLADIKAKIKNVTIGLNKEEKKILIQALDKSTHIHYHNEVGLSDEAILKLSDVEIGKLIKQRSMLNLKAALSDKPDEMQRYLAMYNQTALLVGTASASASAIKLTPMPSGDFIELLPKAIGESSFTPDIIFVDSDGNKLIGEIKTKKKK
jgi:hypothetical protein